MGTRYIDEIVEKYKNFICKYLLVDIYNFLWYIIIMEITALIPDDIIEQIKLYANGKTFSECLIIALQDWISIKRIKELNEAIKKQPLEFQDNFSASSIRSINREQ